MKSLADIRTQEVIEHELYAVNQRIRWIRKDLRYMLSLKGVDGNPIPMIVELSEKYRANLSQELEHREALKGQLKFLELRDAAFAAADKGYL